MASVSKDELRHREELATKLATIEGKVDNLHTKMETISRLSETVTLHDRQIHTWKGVSQAVSGVLALAVTIIASLYAKFRHWF